jgi:hypothetical protein
LRSQNPVVILDNLVGTVSSESLMQLATSTRFQTRLLGASDSPSLPQNATWILTLNNARLVPDIARRAMMISLDAGTSKPWERTNFKIKDLLGWTNEHRPSIVRALLTLARSWVIAGRPEDADLVRGSFESWCSVVGGIVYHAGYIGLMDALRAADARDPDAVDHDQLVLAWLEEQKDMALTALGLGELAQRRGLYEARLPAWANGISLAKRMATIIQGLLGRAICGYRIQVHPAVIGGCRTYYLVPMAPPAAPIEPAPSSAQP